MDAIKRDLDTLRPSILNASLVGDDVKELKRQVAQLQRDVDALRTHSVSNYAPTPAAPSTGRIRLVNTWPETITVFLNQRAYDIPPGQEATTEGVPAGTFTFEILARRPDASIGMIQPRTTRSLAASETYTIHVHPR